MASIFTEASAAKVQESNNSHSINSPAAGAQVTTQMATTAAGWLTNDGEALFAMATASGSILLVKLPPVGLAGNEERNV